jgi:N-acetylneuraminic acid mutarotase
VRWIFIAALAASLVGLVPGAGAQERWRSAAALPVPRTEVAAARLGSEIAVVGGFLVGGDNTARADAYSPGADTWRRLPDLPVAVDHAAAAASGGRLYVVGGYGGADHGPLRTAFVLSGGSWRRLPSLPEGRAAAGAAVVGGRLYVVGGRTFGGLARGAFALNLSRPRWQRMPGPTPREHLAVTARGARVYALAGRLAGANTNLRIFEEYNPARRRWRALPKIPSARGGTAAASFGRSIISVGGETVTGTIATVYAYDVRTRRWRRLPDLPTPRHGLGLVVARNRVYALAGGPQPGLHVSGANEFLPLG